MLPNQIAQRVVTDIKRISGLDASLWNEAGEYLVMTSGNLREAEDSVRGFLDRIKAAEDAEDVYMPMESILEGMGLFGVIAEDEPIYVLAVRGSGERMLLAGRFGVSQLVNLLYTYGEQMDQNRFFQNLLLDNMLVPDIYQQAKKMMIPNEVRRVVYIIEPKREGENLIKETLTEMFAMGRRDYVTAVDALRVVVVKVLEKDDDYAEILRGAKAMADTLSTEAMVSTRISYGTIVQDLKEVSKSYKEASMALEVGRVFYEERSVLGYNELGIGRLIHQLPKSLCEMFLHEVMKGNAPEVFEDDELLTVYTFFDNNLNISETARKLFIHRNTLTYRLEKIQKKTGLDVRIFDEALLFKIAVMVGRHLRYLEGE